MENSGFKDFLATVITLAIFALWIIPAYMYMQTNQGGWGALYVPILFSYLVAAGTPDKPRLIQKNTNTGISSSTIILIGDKK